VSARSAATHLAALVLLVGASIAGAIALATPGCNDACANNACVAPVFDLRMERVNDLAVTRDLAITSAGVVTVGFGAANAFSPQTVTIHPGESVTWNWVSGFHSVISDSSPKAFPDSPAQASGQYTATFPTAGRYDYHCGIHGAMMTGTVVVAP
jgi:plastocyanin